MNNKRVIIDGRTTVRKGKSILNTQNQVAVRSYSAQEETLVSDLINGLTLLAGVGQLGGTLTTDTTLTNNGNEFRITGANTDTTIGVADLTDLGGPAGLDGFATTYANGAQNGGIYLYDQGGYPVMGMFSTVAGETRELGITDVDITASVTDGVSTSKAVVVEDRVTIDSTDGTAVQTIEADVNQGWVNLTAFDGTNQAIFKVINDLGDGFPGLVAQDGVRIYIDDADAGANGVIQGGIYTLADGTLMRKL